LKTWTLPKTLIPVSASTIVQTHQETKRIVDARAMPTGSFAHKSPLNPSVSRLIAAVNASALLINDVRPTSYTTVTDLRPKQ